MRGDSQYIVHGASRADTFIRRSTEYAVKDPALPSGAWQKAKGKYYGNICASQPHPCAKDRVRAQTAPKINTRIDPELQRRLKYFAVQDPQTITERIEELDREWDIERVLAANAASVGALGMIRVHCRIVNGMCCH